MRIIPSKKIEDAITALCVKANLRLRDDVLSALKAALKAETHKPSRAVLQAIVDNAHTAASKKIAICQDTGIPIVFMQQGSDVFIKGDLIAAINKGVEQGYRQGSLRASVVMDPFTRGTPQYAPAITHIDIAPGSSLHITVMPKGFGCENKSQLKMFKPTDSVEKIKEFIVSAVKTAGPDACPPYIVGVGIGGTADHASFLAKKALLGRVRFGAGGGASTGTRKFARRVLNEINALRIGAMGLGGKTTALDVLIETAPTHIAGLPVAVNLSCHALRGASVRL
jgi:fumarate hydratase subunit alpha